MAVPVISNLGKLLSLNHQLVAVPKLCSGTVCPIGMEAARQLGRRLLRLDFSNGVDQTILRISIGCAQGSLVASNGSIVFRLFLIFTASRGICFRCNRKFHGMEFGHNFGTLKKQGASLDTVSSCVLCSLCPRRSCVRCSPIPVRGGWVVTQRLSGEVLALVLLYALETHDHDCSRPR
jgi:hypothetical protein